LVVGKQVAQPVQAKPEAEAKRSEEKQEKADATIEKPKADAS
jgi:hypothetical protein